MRLFPRLLLLPPPLFLVCSLAHGLIASLTLTGSRFDDHLLLAQVLQPTGLARGASLSFSYELSDKDGILTAPPASSSPPPLLVILADEEQLHTYYHRRAGSNDAEIFSVACLAPSALRLELDDVQGGGEMRIAYTDQYALLLLQCSEPSVNTNTNTSTTEPQSLLALTFTVITLNPDLSGRLPHHLGLENVLLPRAYAGLVLAALLLWLVWLVTLYSTKEHATIIHVGCTLALGMKVLELAVHMAYVSRLDAEGEVPRLLRMGNALQDHLSLLSQLMMLALLALGYKVHRASLSGRETRLFAVAVGIYIILAISEAACDSNQHTLQHQELVLSSSSSSSPPFSQQAQGRLYQAYALGEYVIQSMLLLLIIVSVNWNISSLRSSLNTFPWSATSVPLNYQILHQLHFFRGLFLLYLLLPTLLMVARLMLFSWPYAWVDPILRQSINLSIYVALALTFAPTDKTLYHRPFGVAAQWRFSGIAAGNEPPLPPAERLRQRRARDAATAAAAAAAATGAGAG